MSLGVALSSPLSVADKRGRYWCAALASRNQLVVGGAEREVLAVSN